MASQLTRGRGKGMDRRRFVVLIGSALAAPLLAHAQQARRPFRIGFPMVGPQSALAPLTAVFEQGLRDLGHLPGQDVLLEYRSADGKLERYPEVVRQVVGSRPDLIITGSNENTISVKAATQTIPVVMMVGINVVEAGLVKSLARPGGNITGLTADVGAGIMAKRFQLLKEAAPRIRRLAVLYDPPDGTELQKTEEAAAAALGLELVRQDITDDFARTFADLSRANIDAVLHRAGGRQFARRAELVALSAKYRMPSAFGSEEFVVSGGFLSYGANLPDLFRRGAGYVSKIIKGAKPADLPVEQPIKLDLVINLKTAKALGLTIPPSILLRADRVIE